MKKGKQGTEEKIMKKGGHGSVGRIILGTFFIYFVFMIIEGLFFWAYEYSITEADNNNVLPNWIITVLVSVLLFLYNYGLFGFWFMDFGANTNQGGGARNPIKRIFGLIFGTIGFVLRPYPIMIYGANKKKYLYFTAVIPLAVIGAALIFIGLFAPNLIQFYQEMQGDWSTFYYISAAVAFVNALLVLSIKKCPKCNCVMTDIDYDTLGYQQEDYTREMSRQVGSISYGDGTSASVYQHYDEQFEGYRETYAKTYTCLNCGTKKQGKKKSVSLRASNDVY